MKQQVLVLATLCVAVSQVIFTLFHHWRLVGWFCFRYWWSSQDFDLEQKRLPRIHPRSPSWQLRHYPRMRCFLWDLQRSPRQHARLQSFLCWNHWEWHVRLRFLHQARQEILRGLWHSVIRRLQVILDHCLNFVIATAVLMMSSSPLERCSAHSQASSTVLSMVLSESWLTKLIKTNSKLLLLR